MALKKQIRPILTLIALLALAPVTAFAQTSSSSNFRVEEAQFGTGGETDMDSNNFNAQGSAGSLGVGRGSSDNFDVEAGFLTAGDPYLEMVVNGGLVDLGTLQTGSTSYGSTTFYVRAYLTGGYSVVTVSPPPTSEGGATIPGLSTPAAPAPGTEQFGINLVDNSSPDIGANPVNQPDGSFADGQAAAGYDTPNLFKYVVGDEIARSAATVGNQAVGHTDYTISYIANISGVTPAGVYQMHHDLVAVPTF